MSTRCYLFLAFLVSTGCNKQTASGVASQPSAKASVAAADPAKEFVGIAERFPASGSPGPVIVGASSTIEQVSYDVKKTDSALNPLIGMINFQVTPHGRRDERMQLAMVFNWQDGKWVYSRLLWLNNNGVDIKGVARGNEVTDCDSIQKFLASL